MKDISSSHNETYKHLKKLMSASKYRRQNRQTVLEGIHLCQSYLEQVGAPVRCFYTDHAKESQEALEVIEKCTDRSVEVILISESKFREVSTLVNGIGLLFVISQPSLEAPGLIDGSALLLDGVQDPGNLGSIMRTAATAGIGEVYLSNDTVAAWSPKVLRAGMGAQFVLNIYENVNLQGLVAESQVPVLATSLEASESIYDKDLSGPIAWLFGGEGRGVSDDLLAMKVEQVIIPQQPNVESLNVAASAAVCLFEQVRQARSI
ncbi:RNA methyltransferase [Candidatus Saccharibacteria bacterium 32-49-12]|nr:MAG: RNA methyltransferase [Candidatus Saccharibacteria bacterium 32-49-12]